MGKTSDNTLLVREAIREALSRATQPLSAVDIAMSSTCQGLGFDSEVLSKQLWALHKRQGKLFPIARVRSPSGRGTGKALWAYFIPGVVTPLEFRTRTSTKPEPTEPVNAINPPPEFVFNPLEFVPVEGPPLTPVQIPPGVKSITLSIGGVTLKIELAV